MNILFTVLLPHTTSLLTNQSFYSKRGKKHLVVVSGLSIYTSSKKSCNKILKYSMAVMLPTR